MNALILWSDGSLTIIKGNNALKLAQNWLYKYVDVLAVFANKTVYLREG